MSKTQDAFGASPKSVLNKPLLHIQDQQPKDTLAQELASGVETTRNLTVKVTDEIGSTLQDNTFTLPAGLYDVNIMASSGAGLRTNRIYLRDSSDDSLVMLGLNCGSNGGTNDNFHAFIKGRLNLPAPKTLYISHYSNQTGTGGSPISSGEVEPSAIEIYVDIQIHQLDAELTQPKVYQPTNPPVSGAYVTGGIYGGELSYVGLTTFNVASVSCMSDDLAVPLALVGPTLVDLGSPLLNTAYNVFVVKTTGGLFEIHTDTDVDGFNLTDITHKRWLGFVRANASGAICKFIQNGDSMSFAIRSENHLPEVSVTSVSTAVAVDHSGKLPVPRIATIWYGAYGSSSTNGVLASTLDGANNEMYIGRNNNANGDNSLETWGNPQYVACTPVAFDANRLFYRETANMIPLIRAVTMKR